MKRQKKLQGSRCDKCSARRLEKHTASQLNESLGGGQQLGAEDVGQPLCWVLVLKLLHLGLRTTLGETRQLDVMNIKSMKCGSQNWAQILEV